MDRHILRIVGVIVLVIIPCVLASQQPSDANDLKTLGDYLRHASLNNAELKAKFEQWKAALEQVPQVKALEDPKFNYGYFIEEVETKVGPQRHRFGIMQVFPWFGKIEARTDAAATRAKVAQKRYEATKLKLFFQVKDAFSEYAYLARAVEIARENLELIKHFEEVARTKYMAAAAGHPDVIRAQVELAKLEDQLKTIEGLRNPIVARLNAVLNRKSFQMLPWPRREQFQPAKINRQDVIKMLKARNPEIKALEFEVEVAKSTVELAKKKFWPDIGVGVDSIQTDGGNNPIILMFTMNLPIWRESYKAAELQAKANVRKATHQRTETENKIISRTEQALYDFDDSDRKVKLYRDILIPKAEELLGASETAYKTGTIDFLSLIDAQRMLLNYQLFYERAVADNAQRLAELEMLAGSELSGR